MKYRVIVSPEAFEELDGFIHYIANDQHSPLVALRWLKKALAALQTLQTFPHRCPPAPENEFSQYTIRMLVVDRCLFLYRVDEENQTVRVLRFRHGSQLPYQLD